MYDDPNNSIRFTALYVTFYPNTFYAIMAIGFWAFLWFYSALL